MPPTGRLAQKIAIVTGASSGIGRAIALLFAREGARVVCSDIRETSRNETANGDEAHISTHDAIMMKAGGESLFVKCDTSKAEEVEGLVRRVVERFGRVDVYVWSSFFFSFGVEGRVGRVKSGSGDCDMERIKSILTCVSL